MELCRIIYCVALRLLFLVRHMRKTILQQLNSKRPQIESLNEMRNWWRAMWCE